MTPSSKLGTRIAVGAIIAASVAFATASVAGRASGAARVTTVSGTGTPGLVADGGPAVKAALSSPAGVATDAGGDVVIADTGNCRVRYVPNADAKLFGITMHRLDIYTIAGSTCGLSGDNGPATKAQLSFPSDVAFDASGDVYVADTGNNEIRMISVKNGDITTRAGNGKAGFSNDTGLGAGAELDGPSGIAVDAAGDLFIADTDNCRVREVPTRFGINDRAPIPGDIYTVVGNGTCGNAGDGKTATQASLQTPQDVAVDAHGNLLIADTGNRLVREVAAGAGSNFGIAMTPGNIYTVVGSGTYNVYFGDGLPAASDASSVSFPTGIGLDPAGNLYIADTYARAVREVPAAPGTSFGTPTPADAIFTIAGAGPAESPTAGGATPESVVYPSRLAVDAHGNVYVADIGNNSVEKLSGPLG